MLIKTLRLENFRQFKGVTQINFSCDAEKNVTVILGNNTFGKTTLLQAFNWCLYGEVNFDNDKSLLNRELAVHMKTGERETVAVEISLIHDNTEYIVTRTQRYTCGGGKIRGEAVPTVTVSRKDADGQTKSIDSERKMSELINSWLPKDLSTYFFFDTERISTVSERRDIANAVKNFLGLSALENALRHLGDRLLKSTVIGRIYNGMDSDGDDKAQQALNAAQTAREKREVIANRLEECKDQIARYEERKSELEKILRENQSTTDLQKEIDKLERKIADEKRYLADATESFFRDFNADAMKFFMQPLLGHAENFLTTVKVTDKGVRNVTKATIDELIQRGRCICGREICPGNDAYRHLMDEMHYVPPESIGITVRHYHEQIKTFSRDAARVYDSTRQRYEEIHRCKERIAEWEDDVKHLREKISGKESMARYESEHDDIRKRLRTFNANKDRLNQEDGALARDIERYQKIYDSLTARSQKNRETKELLTYAEEIKKDLEPSCRKNEIKLRESLQAEVNKIFDEMYHGQRCVELDEQYQTKLYAVVDGQKQELTLSEGLKRVRNFSFIAGLVALAKKKIFKDLEIQSEAYPLVMDAPFSNTDDEHTANISKVLPRIAEQVIMFVMQKDWANAEDVMIHRVGQKYRLNKIRETFTKVEEA